MSPPQNPLNFSQTIPPQKRKPPSEVSPDSKSSSSKKQKQKESRVKFTLPPVSQVYHHKNKGLEESVIESDVDDNEDLLESQKQKSKTSLRNADDLDSESESEEENNKLDTEDDNEDDENYEGEDGPDEDNRSRTSDDEEDEEEKEIKIVPFSMREELEEGDFDASGTYFLKPRDKFAHHDNWLAGISKKEIKMAAKARQSRIEVDAAPIEPEEELLKRILVLMQPKETITNTLARLHRACKSSRPVGDEKIKALKNEIETITELTDLLLASGRHDIYTETYEDLLGDLRDQGLVPRNWQPITWYFQWSHHPDYHGPFNTSDMVNWVNEGYFDSGITLQQYRNGNAFGKGEYYKGEEILDVLN